MKEAYHYLKTYIKEKDTVVAAISGGPDSMALLSLLLEYRKTTNINIICAHVNHKVRIESDNEEQFVKTYCEKNNLIFEVCYLRQYHGGNFENDAHHQRYAFFETLIQKYNASFLLTAHHGDDLVESVLLKLIRGSSLKGYKGFEIIQERPNYTVLRPLIHETKETILSYNQEKQIQYVTDLSNFEDIHTRNRIRKYILPLLKKENKLVHEKFIKFNQELSEEENYIASTLQQLFSKIYQDNRLDLNMFHLLYNYVQKKIIQRILQEIYKTSLENVHDKHVNMLLQLANGQSGKKMYLPKGVLIRKEYNTLIFEKKIEKTENYSIELKGKTLLPNGHTIAYVDELESNSNFICRLNKKDIVLPLYIRTRKKEDKMQVKHMKGTKKISAIFKECKVPLHERETYPILVDNKGTILWVPGLKKSNFDIEKDEKCDIILRYN